MRKRADANCLSVIDPRTGLLWERIADVDDDATQTTSDESTVTTGIGTTHDYDSGSGSVVADAAAGAVDEAVEVGAGFADAAKRERRCQRGKEWTARGPSCGSC